MKKIGILSSHNGSGFDYIQKACEDKILNAQVVVIISNNTDANVLKKASSKNIPNYIVNSKKYDDTDEEITNLLKKYKCDYVFLSGYMKKIESKLLKEFENKIINTHPSLLPKFGGKGMYGRNVHEAVLKANEKKSGVTLHYVSKDYDEGEFILQNSLKINENETIESLESRIKDLEKRTIIEGLQKIIL